MTEPRFPVQIIRGVPVVVAPQEIDNAEELRAALLSAACCRGTALLEATHGTRRQVARFGRSVRG